MAHQFDGDDAYLLSSAATTNTLADSLFGDVPIPASLLDDDAAGYVSSPAQMNGSMLQTGDIATQPINETPFATIDDLVVPLSPSSSLLHAAAAEPFDETSLLWPTNNDPTTPLVTLPSLPAAAQLVGVPVVATAVEVATVTTAVAVTKTSAAPRKAASCEICYRHKVKCDGLRPCERCIRMRRTDKCHDRDPKAPIPQPGSASQQRKRTAIAQASAGLSMGHQPITSLTSGLSYSSSLYTASAVPHQYSESPYALAAVSAMNTTTPPVPITPVYGSATVPSPICVESVTPQSYHSISTEPQPFAPLSPSTPSVSTSSLLVPYTSTIHSVVPSSPYPPLSASSGTVSLSNKRHRYSSEHWNLVELMTEEEIDFDDEQAFMDAIVTPYTLSQYDEMRITRIALHGLMPWLRKTLLKVHSSPPASVLQAALMMMDRPMCPSCIDPYHRCAPCESTRFTVSTISLRWPEWLQSISMLSYFVPRQLVIVPSDELEIFPMPAITWRMAPEMMVYLHGLTPQSPGEQLLQGLYAATAAVEAMAAAATTASDTKSPILPSPSPPSSPDSSAASPTPSSPSSSINETVTFATSRSSGSPVTVATESNESSQPVITDTHNGTNGGDYGIPPPIQRLPTMPPAVRMFCSQNTAMERLLGFTATEAAEQIGSMGWRLPWRLVWPREAQQLAMANFRGVLGLKREFCLPIHLLTKTNNIVRVMMWGRYWMVNRRWSAAMFFMQPIPSTFSSLPTHPLDSSFSSTLPFAGR